MQKIGVLLLLALLFSKCLAFVHPASAADATPVIPLPYGITKTALLRNGLPGIVALAWRANDTAKGCGVLTVYVEKITTEDDQHALHLVPIFRGDKESFEITTAGGADCQMRDFRLVRTEEGNIQLILAERPVGAGSASDEKVAFQYFDLDQNVAGSTGKPQYYFASTKTVAAKSKYCDVNDAFKAELNLGPYQAD